MTGSWWRDMVLPGFIDGLPLVAISLFGMWLQHRKTRRVVKGTGR